MPAWWGKKPSKSKDARSNSQKSQTKKGKDKYGDNNNKTRSFDEVFGMVLSRNSPRNSREFSARGSSPSAVGGSSGFSGFDSGSSLDRGHPLPKPSCSTAGHDHGAGLGSGSVSGSSISSSGSYDDHGHVDHAQLGAFRHGDSKLSPTLRSPGRSRGTTTTTSPLHPRFGGINLDSPTGKLDDGKSEGHKLPLPPGSPTSPSALPSPRMYGGTESTSGNLSRWRKGKLLGRGTFGHVYLGFNSENGQMCAIKEVRISDDQSSRECLKQLNQEIALLSQLSHPNIVQYHGSELVEDTLSVYLEYVSGGSIHKLLQEYGPFREPVIQNYTRQILSGLAYLHARNTVHRDIKGANILVDPNGEVKLADFGMAKHITAYCSMLSFKGSPYWMAPEVVINTNGYSLPVDIWSLGCTILEMATTKPPWSHYEGVAAIFKIGNSKDMPEIPEELSNDAKSFIKLCLQRDPSARPTALQLLNHPFLKDRVPTRVLNISMSKEVSHHAFDGSRSPPPLKLHSERNSSSNGAYAANSATMISRTSIVPRECVKNYTSLPVSPCSSPLRQYEPARRSCFLSPHPSYTLVGQSGYTTTDYLVPPVRSQSQTSTVDPWLKTPQFHLQTSSRSPKSRAIL